VGYLDQRSEEAENEMLSIHNFFLSCSEVIQSIYDDDYC